MKRVIGLALVGVLSLVLASPVLAGGVRGSGFSGGQGGMHGTGFQKQGGFQHKGGFQHNSSFQHKGNFQHKGGFQHRGNFHRCCWGSPFLGWPVATTILAAPYYDYAYASPVYPEPVYVPAPVYQPQPQVYLAPPVQSPPVQSEMCYIGGCYRLQGDGVSIAFRWVWIPTVPEAPPAPPTAPPASAPAPSTFAPTQLYRWVDDQGVANWTNNREAVPERYRTQPKRTL